MKKLPGVLALFAVLASAPAFPQCVAQGWCFCDPTADIVEATVLAVDGGAVLAHVDFRYPGSTVQPTEADAGTAWFAGASGTAGQRVLLGAADGKLLSDGGYQCGDGATFSHQQVLDGTSARPAGACLSVFPQPPCNDVVGPCGCSAGPGVAVAGAVLSLLIRLAAGRPPRAAKQTTGR